MHQACEFNRAAAPLWVGSRQALRKMKYESQAAKAAARKAKWKAEHGGEDAE